MAPRGLAQLNPATYNRHVAVIRAVAKAITLLESTRAADRGRADALLNALMPAAGGASQAVSSARSHSTCQGVRRRRVRRAQASISAR